MFRRCCCGHSWHILACTWFWCFWIVLIPLIGTFLLYMSFQENTYIESVNIAQLQQRLFVIAAVISMVYVRVCYYPWLMAKKLDPVLPRYSDPLPEQQQPEFLRLL